MAGDSAGFLGKQPKGVVVAGIGAIRIELERSTFELGHAIVGRVELLLDQDVEALKFVAGLRCEQVFPQRGAGRTREQRLAIFRHQDVLDGARTYRSRGYDLHLLLPSSLPPQRDLAGSSPLSRAPRWILYACLYRAHHPNLREVLEIDVGG